MTELQQCPYCKKKCQIREFSTFERRLRWCSNCGTLVIHEHPSEQCPYSAARPRIAVEDALKLREPVPMVLHCPLCNVRHIDEGEFATKPHHTHACQDCGSVWRPAVINTVGVRFLPGFKNEPKPVDSPDKEVEAMGPEDFPGEDYPNDP